MHDLKDVGGTPGGLGEFIMGVIMTCIGGYMLLNQVTVHGGFWSFMGTGGNTFGVSLVPVLLGIGMLFYNGKSVGGWLLLACGSLFILAGIIVNMQIHFQRTSLFNALVMLVTLVGGLGLILRSLRPHNAKRG